MIYDTRLEPSEEPNKPTCYICGTTEDLDRVGYNKYICGDCRLDRDYD